MERHSRTAGVFCVWDKFIGYPCKWMHQHGPALEFNNISKRYHSLFRGQSVIALSGFSLRVERGEIFGFLGPNGAGKTTAIHIALGFLFASGGRGAMLGQRFGSAAAHKHVGFLAADV